jgi:PAS domain-containing protein
MGVPLQTLNHSHADDRLAGQPLSANWSHPLGWFRYCYDDDRWVWSPRVEQLHGYRPGSVAPSTTLVLSHIHPDDGPDVAAALRDARRTRRPFGSSHRIVDTAYQVRDVVVVGAPFYDKHGRTLGMQGFYLDLTPEPATCDGHDHRERAAHKLRALADGWGHAEDRRQAIRDATRC